MKKTPEDYVRDDIKAYLDTLTNCWYDVRQVNGFGYKKGLPDIYGCYYGYHFEIEVKREKGGKTSPLQDRQKHILLGSNTLYILANNLTLVQEKFKEVKDYAERHNLPW